MKDKNQELTTQYLSSETEYISIRVITAPIVTMKKIKTIDQAKNKEQFKQSQRNKERRIAKDAKRQKTA